MIKTTENNYLRKYANVYKLQKADDGIWQIRCSKRSFITFWGWNNSASSISLGYYISPVFDKKLAALQREFKILGVPYDVVQRASQEAIIKFNEEHLQKLANLLKIKSKKHLTPAHLACIKQYLYRKKQNGTKHKRRKNSTARQ